MKQEVVEHACYAVHHGLVAEDGLDFPGDHLQRVYGVVAHHVVVARQHGDLAQRVLILLTLLWFQGVPFPPLLLCLFVLYLGHVLLQRGQDYYPYCTEIF